MPILTDIHEPAQAAPAAEVADVLQIPAFLSRQTDLLVAAARTGRVVNIKKGQFLAPARHAPRDREGRPAPATTSVIVTERGFSFGYNNLVVDMRAFPILRALGYPVVYDVTHSLQLPGGGDGVTAGQAEFIEPLASRRRRRPAWTASSWKSTSDPAAGEERRAERAAARSASSRCSTGSCGSTRSRTNRRSR